MYSFIRGLCGLAVLFCGLAQAQVLHSEYQFLAADQVIHRIDPSDISREYESDFATYFPQFSLLGSYYAADKSFLASVGSLGKKHFMLRQALKAKFPMAEKNLHLSFIQSRDKDYEDQLDLMVFDMTYDFGVYPGYAIGVFGQAAYLKAQDDIGVYLQKSRSNFRHRWSYLMSDFSRNERTTGTDRQVRKPQSVSYLYEKRQNNQIFTRISVNYRFLSVWYLPSEGGTFADQGYFVDVFDRRKTSPIAFTNILLSYVEDHRRKWGVPIDERKRVRFYYGVEYPLVETGLWLSCHSNQQDSQELGNIFVQPLLWVSNKSYNSKSRWRFGPSFVAGYSDGRIGTYTRESDGFDYRMNVLWENQFIKLIFGFDVDRLGKSDTWEGGNIQAQADF